MKAADIRELNAHEIETKLEELRTELFNLRFRKVKNLLDRPDRMRLARREIARLLTILKEKETRGE